MNLSWNNLRFMQKKVCLIFSSKQLSRFLAQNAQSKYAY